MKKLSISALLLVLCATVGAKVTLPGFFSDNMVLQQNAQVRLWGWADKGKTVIITPSWSKATVSAKAGDDGRWSATVATPAFEAGRKYSVTFSDGQPTTIGNVLVGEVWICTGQSNMQRTIKTFNSGNDDASLRTILGSGAYRDRIRFVTFPLVPADKPQSDIQCSWVESGPATTPDFSATAYYFARNLADATGVPVGIVSCSWGGSKIEAWIDEPTLKKAVPDADMAALTDPKAGPNHVLANIYNGMLSPLIGFTAKGFLWYQGESNRPNYFQYAALMQAMVALWRSDWGDRDNKMPFYYVQIAPYGYGRETANGTSVPLIVEAQIKALGMIPNSGIAGTTDAGDEFDIHPAKKEVVGFRLCNLVLVNGGGYKNLPATGPIYKSVKFDGDKAVVTFTNAPGGLLPAGGNISGFEVAGSDRVFRLANATAERNRPEVTVTSPEVKDPVAVRYAFRNVPNANMYNFFGLPAFPFRTDDWEIRTTIEP